MDFTRPTPPDPYSLLPVPATFELTSADVTEGDPMAADHAADGGNTSPALAWSGFPPETKSFVVSCFDPDAPTPSGYWHWHVLDVPASVTSLPRGAGSPDGDGLPAGAFQLTSDGGQIGFEGAGPPPGDHAHRYVFAVHALDVDTLGLTTENTNVHAAFNVYFHVIARATLTGTYRR
ncbi:YbhB/YbcL family Raf kinase inhibitor-like protein [Isoptericola sediminis]|uniref:YbhB/YbcL family Raf kinase inhibitor-like protein n=1 Tax=Isoptericola sediminis TaxID=2733572 RepID=A0A849K3I9_9MICO|nr:YbhB/YbcL family Raf kinase inhibitor-like protein [Isoptericola sediminis]NNU26345.1 YbhB/YbcL family Raf kinase inhibitor-like protein [Isoptericola sediminis]